MEHLIFLDICKAYLLLKWPLNGKLWKDYKIERLQIENDKTQISQKSWKKNLFCSKKWF